MARSPRQPRRSPVTRPNHLRPALEALEDRLAPAATITVNSALDSDLRDSVLTLREAILVNNRTLAVSALTAVEQAQVSGTPTSLDTDTLAFNIPGIGVQTITPLSNLPTITDPAIIDGYTQPGASRNTLADGSNAVLLVQLSGSGLVIAAGDSTVRGLVINGGTFTPGISLQTNGGNVIEGNFLGTNAAGTARAGNQYGVRIISTPSNTIGGLTAEARNVISGNTSHGIFITGTGATENRVLGNLIGTDAAGTAGLGNTAGVVVQQGAANNRIGGAAAGARNVISANTGPGVTLNGAGVNTNQVQGNYIGTDVTGTGALGNTQDGVNINIGTGNLIGGTTAGAGNVISGNGLRGIAISGTGGTAAGTQIHGNLIGTDVSGTMTLGNVSRGIDISDAPNTQIGGTSTGTRNLISGNKAGGIRIVGSNARGTQIQGNSIGTDAMGTLDLRNQGAAIFTTSSASNTTVGGATAGAGNLIAFNFGPGVDFSISAGPNTILGNFIYSNAGHGVRLDVNATSIRSNTIHSNGGVGVWVSSGTGNAVLSNSIHSNVRMGIDLGASGVASNDVGDADTGANNLQNFPVLSAVSSSGSSTTVQGTLNSRPNTTYTLEFFANAAADPLGFGEGQTFLGSATVTTDANGNASFTVSFSVATPAGQVVSATATDPGGNTSEFSQVRVAMSANQAPVANPDAYSINEDGTLTVVAAGVLANDSDPDGNPITAVLVGGTANGALSLSANGSFIYTPAANFFGADSFTYRARDNSGTLSGVATVTLTVNAVNDAPSFIMPTDVSVALSSTNGTVAHGSVRVNDGQIGGGSTYAGYYNGLPVLAPFQSPTGAGGRYANYPGVGTAPFFIYSKLDGAGAFSFSQTGTILGVPSGTGTFTNPGTYLPTTAHTGTLAAPLFLPGGTVLATGTTIYSDYAGLTLDLNDPASYWLDGSTGTEHRTYHAGRWSFYHQSAGAFVKFAEFADVTQSFRINFGTGSVTGMWAGTPVPVNGFSLPASGSSSVAEAINTTGVLTNEMVSPFTGFYGRFPNSLSITFDVPGVAVAEDAGAQSVANWARSISPGTANESGQAVQFVVTNSNSSLFAVQPMISANGTLAFTPAPDAHGTATVTVALKDNGGTANGGKDTSAAQTFTITITPVNDAPVANDDSATTDEDVAVTIDVLANDTPGPETATDEVGQTLAITQLNGVAVAPGDAVATAYGSVALNADGTVTYTPAPNYNGPDSFSYTVTDSGAPPASATASGLVTIDPVNDAPMLATTSATFPAINEDNVTNAGTSVAALLADVTIIDVDADPLRGIAITGVDDASGAWQFSTDGGVTWTAFGSPLDSSARLLSDDVGNRIRFVPIANYFGPAAFTFRAWDRTNGTSGGTSDTTENGGTCAFSSAVGIATITVRPVNDAPVAVGNSYATDEDTPLVVAAPGLLGNDSDVDSAILSAVMVSDPAHGALTLNADGSFTYIPALDYFGPDGFTYKATDGELDSEVVTVTITINAVNDAPVADAGSDQGKLEGETVQFDGRGSSDVEGDSLSYSWEFGDGATGSGATPTHAFADNGIFTVTLTVSDGALSHRDTMTVLVTNISPTAVLSSFGPVVEGSQVTVSFAGESDPSSADTAAGFRYSFALDPDDLADTYAGAGAASSTAFTFADNGIFSVHGRVFDDDDGYTDYVTEVEVENVAPQNVNAGADHTVNEGSPVNFTGRFTDPGSADTHTQLWSVVASNGQVIANGSGANYSFVPNDNGTYNITYTVTDDDNGVGTDTAVVTVLNVNPTVDLTGPAVGTVYAVGSPIPFVGTYSDPGLADTHTAKLRFYSVGTGETFTTPVSVTGGTISLPTSISAAGVYTVMLIVTDDDLGVGSDSDVSGFEGMVVIYDPSAGFVTGGGWINSPAGAFTANAILSGRASFGFVSKYHTGATTPTGQTQFQFRVADFNFHSTSYDWLVISGARAQYRGDGTINGVGGYSFMLTAIDGQISGGGGQDKFRIKIWDKATGNVIYDNQLAAADDAEPSTVLGGGSVVIHKGNPLQAAALPADRGPVAVLTNEQLRPIVAEAIARWAATGLTAEQTRALGVLEIRTGDLGDRYLGMEYPAAIQIDDDAAGWGWFVDPTPEEDSEFLRPGDQGERGQIDLLTVVIHELGHALGLADLDPDVHAGALMAATLTAGTRRLPATGEIAGAIAPALTAPDSVASVSAVGYRIATTVLSGPLRTPHAGIPGAGDRAPSRAIPVTGWNLFVAPAPLEGRFAMIADYREQGRMDLPSVVGCGAEYPIVRHPGEVPDSSEQLIFDGVYVGDNFPGLAPPSREEMRDLIGEWPIVV